EEHVTHAGHTGELVLHLHESQVAQVKLIVPAVGRVDRQAHEDIGRALDRRHAGLLDDVGQERDGQVDTILHQHLGHVDVNALLEGQRKVVAAVVGALGGHVQDAFHAVDLLLDGSRDGVSYLLGGGTRIAANYLHRGRRDVRELREWQREQGNDAGQGD